MLRSRHIDKIVLAVTVLFMIATFLFMNGGAFGLKPMVHTMGYEDRLFDNTKVHTIDIVMDDWDDLIANAESEEYYDATLVIDGETFHNTAIRGKGNTSLSMVSSMDSERYSFKVEFDHYDSSITYHGLDKLSLNNLIQDATMMKDYLTYTMMNEFGAAAPLCSFVYITVNGEDWGLYLAVEGVEDSFLERNYGSDYGELYKPDSMNMGGGRGNGKDFNMDDVTKRDNVSDNTGEAGQNQIRPQMPDMSNFDPSQIPEDVNSDISKMPEPPGAGNQEAVMPNENGVMPSPEKAEGDRGGGGMGSADVKLQYIDDEPDSYSNIWNGAKTAITDADKNRLIQSLKKLSANEDIASVVDVDAVIRYFVVHNYVCNGDSYTGTMIHNYYLYEEDGVLSMLPWDYNLAFGTFQGGNAQSTINTPIDSPISGGDSSDRPMWNWIAANEEYTEQYHQYFAEFLNTVPIDSMIDNACTLIRPYVEKDPTAFYTVEEFEKGVETLRQFCNLRSESISMQLADGETAASQNYADATGITLSDMGSMGRGNMPDMGNRASQENDDSTFPGNMQPPGGDMPFGNDNAQTGAERPSRGEMPDREAVQPDERNNPQIRGAGNTGWLWILGSVLLLGAGILIAKLYKR